MTEPAPAHETYTLAHLLVAAGVRDNLEFARGIRINPAMLPKQHQIDAINLALMQPNNRFGLYDETGCMKTFPMQAYALYQAGLGNKCVCIMPPILLEQFKESLGETFIGYEKYFSLHILTEGPDERDDLFAMFKEDGWPDLLLMTYQMFSRVPRAGRRKDKVTGEWKKTPSRQQDFLASVLREAGYWVLIADEAHNLRNSSSLTTKTVQHFLGYEGDRALFLATGTPVFNTLMDTYSLIRLVTPRIYNSKKQFERTHCLYINDSSGWSRLVGFDKKNLIHRNLYLQARRVTKDQVLSLKEPQIIKMSIDLDPQHRDLYKKLVKERMLEVKGEIVDALTQQSLREKCLQIVTTPEHFSDYHVKNNIIEACDEILDSIGLAQEKVVLFGAHQRTIEALGKHYAEHHPVLVYGKSGGGEANRRAIETFKHDPQCRLAIMHPNSGGVGLNLQDVCRFMIFVEPLSVPGQFKQAADRIHRGEIKHVVTFYILIARGTLGPTMVRNMLVKENDIMMITRDRRSVLSELLDES